MTRLQSARPTSTVSGWGRWVQGIVLALVLGAASLLPPGAQPAFAQTCEGWTVDEILEVMPQFEAAAKSTSSETGRLHAEWTLKMLRGCLAQLGASEPEPTPSSRPTQPASEVGTCGPLRGGPVCATQEGLADYTDWLAGRPSEEARRAEEARQAEQAREAEEAQRAEEAARLEGARQADVDLLKQVPLLREPPPPARSGADDARGNGVCAFDAGFNCVPIEPGAEGRYVVMDSAGDVHLQVNGRMMSITGAEETLLRVNALDRRAQEGVPLGDAPWLLNELLPDTPALELSKGIADLRLWWLAGEEARRTPTDLAVDLGPEANLRINLYREAEAAELAGPFALEAAAQLYPGTQAVISDRPDETGLCFKGSASLVKVGTKPVNLCTPNAVAAVHGTTLSADYVETDSVQRTIFRVSEGSVVIRDRFTGEEYAVEAGSSQVIERRLPEPTRAPAVATPVPAVPTATPTPLPRPSPTPTPSVNSWVGRWTGTYSGTSYARDPAAAAGYQCDSRAVRGTATLVLSRDGDGLSAEFTFGGAALGYVSCGPLDHTGQLYGSHLVGPVTATSATFRDSLRSLTLTKTSAGTLSGTYAYSSNRRINITLSLTR